jgi:hypothetical protein
LESAAAPAANATDAMNDAAAESLDELCQRIATAALLHTQLVCARHGVLDADWRTAVLAAAGEPVEELDEHHQQMQVQAAETIANLPNADWEPDMKVGWRASLESWHAATTACLADLQDAQRRIHQEAALSTSDLEAGFVMDRDLQTASYRAGLTAAGLVSDWPAWLRGRVQSWPPGPRRDSQLAALDDPDYRRQLQQLPRYWA